MADVYTAHDNDAEYEAVGIETGSGWCDVRINNRVVGSFYMDTRDQNLARARQFVRAFNNHNKLVIALNEALTYFEDHSDVKDGPEGRQLPNRCMALAQELREVLDHL